MKGNKSLIKLVVLIVFVSMLLCCMVGCDKEGTLDDNNDDKPIIKDRMEMFCTVNKPNKTFKVDEEVVVELYFGTTYTKEEIEAKQMQADGKRSFPEVTLYHLDENKHLHKNFEPMVIHTIKDFNNANYPMIYEARFGEAQEVVIPREAFIEKSGTLMIKLTIAKNSGHVCIRYLFYHNDDGVIRLFI